MAEKKQECELCHKHSGLEAKVSLLRGLVITLISVLLLIGGGTFTYVRSIDAHAEQERKELQKQINGKLDKNAENLNDLKELYLRMEGNLKVIANEVQKGNEKKK